MTSVPYKLRFLNLVLRLFPLLAKFLLVIYMGRFLSLDDVGVFGLISATALLLTTVLGQKFDYVVMRDIVVASDKERVLLTRDELLFFGLNYLVLAIIGLAIALSGAAPLSLRHLFYLFILTVLESYGTILCFNMVSIGRQLVATSLIFVRTGLWVLPVLLIGFFSPRYRDVDTVLLGWTGGGVLNLVLIAWFWRKWPWIEAIHNKVDWNRIFRGVQKSSFIWIGGMGIAAGVYLDRFVVATFLDLKLVGVLTIFFSFTNTVLTLMQSGVTAFSYPKLVSFYKSKNYKAFHSEALHATLHLAFGSAGMVFLLAIGAPFFAIVFDKPVIIEEVPAFYLMLVGTWLRANAEAPYIVLYARHQDGPIWKGNLLFLFPALGFNLLFVPYLGLAGIGVSSILSGLFLLVWRWYFAKTVIENA